MAAGTPRLRPMCCSRLRLVVSRAFEGVWVFPPPRLFPALACLRFLALPCHWPCCPFILHSGVCVCGFFFGCVWVGISEPARAKTSSWIGGALACYSGGRRVCWRASGRVVRCRVAFRGLLCNLLAERRRRHAVGRAEGVFDEQLRLALAGSRRRHD